ncbi:MAG: SusC/RagA family TonB-linked outer membrane protein [Ferruginibacter sp.]
MKKKSLIRQFAVMLLVILFVNNLSAQEKSLSGQVTSETGLPLSGASVMIEGSSSGVLTDDKGSFTLPVTGKHPVIIFSFTGMATQRVKYLDQGVLNIKMAKEETSLSEVVVTAVGLERSKKSLGYSATVISGTPMAQARETNVINSLKGRVAGVFINQGAGGAGSSSYVVIRGAKSFSSAKNQPLYVVDGVPILNETSVREQGGSQFDFGDGVSNINPDDVETMTILKGPNASSLYGSRGANGVILITTKKGKSGKGVRVEFNSNATFENPNSVPKFQRTWGGGYDDDYASFDDVTLSDGTKASMWPNWLIDNWGGKLDGRPIVFQDIPDAKPIAYTAISDKDLLKFFNTGKTYTNSLTLSGGNSGTTYRVSASNMDTKGITPNSELNRKTFDVILNSNLGNKLSIAAKANYINQVGKNRPSIGGSFLDATTNLQLTPVFIPLSFMQNYLNPNGTVRNFRSLPVNPYWVVNKVKTDDTRDRLIGFVSLEYKLKEWLKIMARSGVDLYNDNRNVIVPDKNPIGGYQTGYVKNENAITKEINNDFLITANGELNKKIGGSFSVGGNNRVFKYESVQQVGTNKTVDNLWVIENMRDVQNYKFVNKKTVNSLYFAGQLSYNSYLYLDVTGRNDWSSSLGVNNYSFFYPSVSSSFVFSDLPSFKSKTLSYGKLRLSYGMAGNDADPYLTTSGYFLGATPYIGGQRVLGISSQVPLLDLKNELTNSFEAGTELKLWNNIGIDFTYYDATTKNQIMQVVLPVSTGYSTKLINAGAIRNRGVEVLVSASIIKSGSFRWDASLNISKNVSKVKTLTDNIKEFTLFDAGAAIVVQEGQPFGNIVGSAYKRSPDGKIVVDSDGNYLTDDKVKVLGNIQPKILGGFTNTFSYKNFSLRTLVDARIGGKVYSRTKQDQWQKGTGVGTEDPGDFIVDGVVEQADHSFKENTKKITRMEMFAYRGWGNIGEEFVLDATTVSLREVSLSWGINTSFWKNRVKGLTLSLVGRNLLYIYRDKEFAAMGISSESSFAPTAAAQGIESRNMPITRSIGVNLNVIF